jgi:hypothetical protein
VPGWRKIRVLSPEWVAEWIFHRKIAVFREKKFENSVLSANVYPVHAASA